MTSGGPSLPVRMIAWEITRRCPYNCRHCRAQAADTDYGDELTTEECRLLVDSIAQHTNATLLLTGGEPMYRNDIYETASYAAEKGIRVVMAPCGAMINDTSAVRIRESGIVRLSLSLDGADEQTHDSFRNMPGAYNRLMTAIKILNIQGIPFQINTTVSRHNAAQMHDIFLLSKRLGAIAFHPFFLVPVGRGRGLADLELSTEQYDSLLEFFCSEMVRSDYEIRITCAPQFTRVLERLLARNDSPGRDRLISQRGCLAGDSFLFISHRGILQPCGFLELPCGSLREYGYNLHDAYTASTVLKDLKERERYKENCGGCAYLARCGGCRARAYEKSGDYMGGDPHCR